MNPVTRKASPAVNTPPLLVALGAAALLPLTACSSDDNGSAGAGEPGTSGAFPMTIQNCGTKVTLEKAPERVLLLKSASVQYLVDLGVTDKVIARAGAYPRGYYDDATWETIEKIPSLSDALDPSGHLQVSKEVVLAQKPDLVLGISDNLNHETLGAAGIPVLEEPALCPKPEGTPSFDTVADQFRRYGQVFGVPEKGEAAAERTQAQVTEVEAGVPSGATRTAAVLYPTVGGGVTYAYGNKSMAEPQLEAAGLSNVFADVDERVFEVTAEELIGRNPDVLVLIHSDGEADDVKQAVLDLKGSSAINAVKNDDVLVQLFNFTEPPSPLAVEGLRRIVERFDR